MKVILVSGRAGSGKTKKAEELFAQAVAADQEVAFYDEGRFVAQHLPKQPAKHSLRISTAVLDQSLTVSSWYA